MSLKLILLACFVALSACSLQSEPQKVPLCTGNTLVSCTPVVYFDWGSAQLSSEAKRNLNWVVAKMQRFPRRRVVASGYTDNSGRPDKNLILSKKRSLAVKSYLVRRGVDEDRIITEFNGEAEPVCTKRSCQPLNRRVELRL